MQQEKIIINYNCLLDRQIEYVNRCLEFAESESSSYSRKGEEKEVFLKTLFALLDIKAIPHNIISKPKKEAMYSIYYLETFDTSSVILCD